MKINFVGLFNQPGYVGEVSDETHIARELESLGHSVRKLPRDEWREYVIEKFPVGKYKNIPEDLKADINLIAKWHHFYDGDFIDALREKSGGPVFYWVWDFMDNEGFPEWHVKMTRAADLYLSGEEGIKVKYKAIGVKHYYFQMDVCDGKIPVYYNLKKVHDVIFTGSCIGQGNRKEWLQIINKEVPVKIWGWGHEDWKKLGFEANPPVYGAEYNKLIAESHIVLGFSVEPNCFGYWSNRVGKVLRAGGFLLQEYSPGMEQYLDNRAVDYFSSPEEAVIKIKRHLLNKNTELFFSEEVNKYTSRYKVKQLEILMDRYLKGKPEEWIL